MQKRLYNFNAGPAVLPMDALDAVRDNLFSYSSSGIGLLEMSHRSSHFERILGDAEQHLRQLLDISDDYAVIFTTGGASNQFSMVPMNLLQDGRTADYVLSGSWSEKALSEAAKFGATAVAASSKEGGYRSIPRTVQISQNSAYLHFTSNNTIYGTQFKAEPETGGSVLVCDASSDLLHKKIDVANYGLIYAGAQKNLGPAGVTLVIIRRDLLNRAPTTLPKMMNYRTYVESNSLYNTPPVFAIFMVGEVLKWLVSIGGLPEIERRNHQKASLIYAAIDESDFYAGHAAPEARSLMNITFRLKNSALESSFLEQAAAAGFIGLKGHRSVGGIRASIYNAFPLEGAQALTEFMRNFKAGH